MRIVNSEMYFLMLVSFALTFNHVKSAHLISIPQSDIIPTEMNNSHVRRPLAEEYNETRENFFRDQLSRELGYDVKLSADEQKVNNFIMKLKRDEIEKGIQTPFQFLPSRHIFEVLQQINSSKLFKFIRKLPKGGILHAHDTALCSADYIVTLLRRDNLWQCGEFDAKVRPQFKFSQNEPIAVNGCQWKKVSEIRTRLGDSEYDRLARKLFTLYSDDPRNTFKDINDVWRTFMNIFTTLDPIVTYAPVFKDYYYQALKELYEDGVTYLEFRGLFPTVYDFERTYGPVEIAGMYVETLKSFMDSHPGFLGSKFVYAPIRFTDDATFDGYLKTVEELREKYPNFIAGFDLVGQEDLGRPLKDYASRLLKMPEDLNFFFHAGETNWHGTPTDENLIDAVLLGAKRIGHGFASIKHPKVLEEIKRKHICLEVNPISNQVLKLVDDYRNHPAAFFFSDNYPVIISSDDPSFWETTPLSHDFYMAFLGIASAHQDLRVLKKISGKFNKL
uniref:Adenosine deaminase n=1 Tax=Corethrella appendiculata TaxID=1370023 RepID=U5ESN9_9DIPT